MGDRTATVIIEPRSLMREALVSLMENLSYHVICSAGSTAEIDCGTFKDAQPELVILGTMSGDRALEATRSIRRCWQSAKITMLFEDASLLDLQKLLASGLDACIPMFASPRTLTDTLQLVVGQQLRVLMMSDPRTLCASSDRPDDEDGAMPEKQALATRHLPSFQVPASATPCARNLVAKNTGDNAARAGAHGLSEREAQILKALVRGHSNKVIARMCTVTEATVKVHVKSILRKIRVANRTQAAIWALRNAYFADDMGEATGRMPPTSDLRAVPSVNRPSY
jgi:two-component system nitrate/nitrite response regulator NarL